MAHCQLTAKDIVSVIKLQDTKIKVVRVIRCRLNLIVPQWYIMVRLYYPVEPLFNGTLARSVNEAIKCCVVLLQTVLLVM